VRAASWRTYYVGIPDLICGPTRSLVLNQPFLKESNPTIDYDRATLAAFCERVNTGKQQERSDEVYTLHAETLEALAEDEKEMKRLQASAAEHKAFLARCEEAAAKIISDDSDPILVALKAPTPSCCAYTVPSSVPAPAQVLVRDADD
jgi:hypothetical protein